MEKKQSVNALYNCCISEPWLDVIAQLDRELSINPAYYIGWEADNSHKIIETHPNCFYQKVEDAWLGLGFPDLDYKFSFDEDIMQSIAFEKALALKMMDRLDLGRNTFTFSNREMFFNKLLKYWINIIEHYNINLIISPSIPHRVFDYVLYIVAKMKNIDVIMFQMSPFPDSSFLIDTVSNTPKYLKEYLQTETPSELVLRSDIAEKLEKVRQDYNVAIPAYMIKQQKDIDNRSLTKNMFNRIKNLISEPFGQFKKDDSYYIMKTDDLPYKKDNRHYQRKIARYSNAHYLKKLKEGYQKVAIKPDFDKKYVFVALHYQPEETSSPTGGIFGDQILIIELLNAFLDDEYQIYIKEHKTQLYPDHDGAMSRNKNYYKYTLEISDRVHFIDMETTPFDLIDGAAATVTISGTTGWESAVRGTPALVFGRAWYEDMPGVFKVKTLRDLEKNWSKILELKNNIDIKEIEEYHKKLQSFFIDAPHYKFFQNKVERSAEENSNNIFNGIEKHLSRIDFFSN